MTMIAAFAAAGNESLSAQSVRTGLMTAAQPSFNGHGWLVVVNLSLMTVTALLAAMVVTKLIRDLWAGRRGAHGPLVTLLRVIMMIAFTGMMLRTGVEAVTLWGWDPFNPDQTGWYLTLKRLIDPFGALAYFVAMCIFKMTEDVLVTSLERKPFPARLIASLPKLRRPAALAVLTIVAAIGVVSTR